MAALKLPAQNDRVGLTSALEAARNNGNTSQRNNHSVMWACAYHIKE
mgnify:CR=1 FL=1